MKGGVYRMLTIQDLFIFCIGMAFGLPTFFFDVIPHLSSEPFFRHTKVWIASNKPSFTYGKCWEDTSSSLFSIQ